MKCPIRILAPLVLFLAASIGAAASPSDLDRDRTPRKSAGRLTAPRAASPVALKAFNECAEFNSYLTDVVLETLIRHKYWWVVRPWFGPERETGGGDSPTDYTTTNVQEEGVDELDIVKTDGTHIYFTTQRSLRVARSWPAEATAEIASLPTGIRSDGLFLTEDRALTVALDEIDEPPYPTHASWFTNLQVVDVSDPSAPWIERTLEVEGWLVDARRIEDDVYLVVRNWISEPNEIWEVLEDPDIDLPELVIGGIGDPDIHITHPFGILIVNHDDLPVTGLEYIALHPIDSDLQCRTECPQGILRIIARITTMRRDPVDQKTGLLIQFVAHCHLSQDNTKDK